MVSSSVVIFLIRLSKPSFQAARFSPLSAHELEGRFSALAKTARTRSSARARRRGARRRRSSLVQEKNGRRDSSLIVFLLFLGGTTTYSFLTSVTAVVMAGSVASA